MNKLVFGLLGALALGASALPSAAAPAALSTIDAPLNTAVFHADGTDAHATMVQYRREEYRRGPPPRHRRHYRHHRRPHFYGR